MPPLKDALIKPDNIGERIEPNPAPPLPPIVPREQSGLANGALGPAPNLWTTDYDRVRQFTRPGVSQQRLPPLPTKADAQKNAASSSVTQRIVNPVIADVAQNTALLAALQPVTFQGSWNSTILYAKGATVDYAGIIYTSLVTSNLGNQPDISPTDWQAGGTSEFLGNWNNATSYVTGDQVIDVAGGGGYYIATTANTNAQPSANPSLWQLITPGNVNAYVGNYSGVNAYIKGQIVSYLGSQWVCISPTTGNAPSTTSSFWTLLGSNALFMGTWNSGTAYSQNMTVERNGNFYQAIQASTNQDPVTATSYWQLTGPSTLDNLEDGTFYIRGIQYQGSSLSIPNSNFVAGTAGWTAIQGTIASDTASPFTNGMSMKCTTTAGNETSAGTVLQYKVTPGDNILYSAYLKSDGTYQIALTAVFLDGSGSQLSATDTGNTTSTSWAVYSNTVTAPANAATFLLRINRRDAGVGTASAWITNVNAVRLTSLGSEVQDGPSNFSATASTLTYRPTSNPLTSTDAGSNATVSIASFTMQTSNKGAISVNSGSVTALSYGTLYYIYYDDPTLAGGSVTFHATTTKTTAINGSGRFFVGSLLSAVSGGPQTTGNGDGGVGAQNGGTFVFLFGATSTAGTSGAGTVTNPNNAIDGDQTTFAALKLTNSTGSASNAQLAASAAAPSSAPWSSLTLYVRSAVPTNNVTVGTGVAAISYAYPGTSGTIYSLGHGVTRSLQTDSVSLPTNVNLALLTVTASLFRNDTFAETAEMDLYEIYVVGVI